MTDADGYLSRDRQHLARQQRERRARMTRVDYMPNRDALAIIEAMRAMQRPGSAAATNSAVLDAIVAEWAALTGIKWNEVRKPMTSAKAPELSDQYAHARMSPDAERSAGAYESDWMARKLAALEVQRAKQKATRRVTCGARRHRDGQPCQAKSEPGKRRCRFHGGRSTGPRTPDGKARALANLRQNRPIAASGKADCPESTPTDSRPASRDCGERAGLGEGAAARRRPEVGSSGQSSS